MRLGLCCLIFKWFLLMWVTEDSNMANILAKQRVPEGSFLCSAFTVLCVCVLQYSSLYGFYCKFSFFNSRTIVTQKTRFPWELPAFSLPASHICVTLLHKCYTKNFQKRVASHLILICFPDLFLSLATVKQDTSLQQKKKKMAM